MLFSFHGWTQESRQDDPSQMGREQWQDKITAARARSELARRERKLVLPEPPTIEELAEASPRRALEDEA
jgi:hypothetical protein